MTATITKVTNYEVILNLTHSELEVFKAIMSNLKISEVRNAVGLEKDEQKISEIYDKFKLVTNLNIKVGN